MKLFTHGYFLWDLNGGGGADYHAWVKEWGMWLIVAELKLFKKHPSITQHTVTIHHRFKAACKFKFAHQKKKKKHTCSDSKSWPWTDSLTVISQSVCVCISALLLNETFWRQQAGGLSVCGCQFTSTSDTSRALTQSLSLQRSRSDYNKQLFAPKRSRRLGKDMGQRFGVFSSRLSRSCRHPPTFLQLQLQMWVEATPAHW